jgi:hypothetical protein
MEKNSDCHRHTKQVIVITEQTTHKKHTQGRENK